MSAIQHRRSGCLIHRRDYLLRSPTLLATGAVHARSPKRRRICIAAQRHTVNIGDIAHAAPDFRTHQTAPA